MPPRFRTGHRRLMRCRSSVIARPAQSACFGFLQLTLRYRCLTSPGFERSSRCNDPFPRGGGERLSAVRQKLKDELEAAELFGQRLFQVWINEDAPAASGDDGWDACMKQVDDADVVLVLYNGDAGWTGSTSGVGICHGELKRAL